MAEISLTGLGMSHADDVAEYYDRQTESFYLRLWDEEDIHFGLFDATTGSLREALKAMTRRIVEPAGIISTDRVVDAGCGVGGAAIDIARTYGCHVHGLTVSQRQVDLARQRAAAAGIADRLSFDHADCAAVLPLDDGCVDVVITIEAACHFEDKRRFLEECRRVLKPGGRIVGTDWMRTATADESEEGLDAIDSVEKTWRLAHLFTLDEWRQTFTETGFDVIELGDLGETVTYNAALLADAQYDLRLEAANGLSSPANFELWMAQYKALSHAWMGGFFTIGLFRASVI